MSYNRYIIYITKYSTMPLNNIIYTLLIRKSIIATFTDAYYVSYTFRRRVYDHRKKTQNNNIITVVYTTVVSFTGIFVYLPLSYLTHPLIDLTLFSRPSLRAPPPRRHRVDETQLNAFPDRLLLSLRASGVPTESSPH